MNRQEKVEFLNRYKDLDDAIDQKCDEMSMWRARATKITPTYSDMPKGGQQGDKIQSAVEKMYEVEREIDSDIDRLIIIKRDIIKAICSIENRMLRRLLFLKYLDKREDYTWEQTAVKMNYTYRHITRMHGLALDKMHVVSCP